MRLFACAGVLSAGLLMSAGISFADTGDASGAAPDAATVTSKSDDNNSDSGASGASNPEPPTSTFGNGRENVDVKTSEDEQKNNDVPAATPKKYKESGTKNGSPNPCLFYTTLLIPVRTLGELFSAMQPQPQPPAPAPGPMFKTQEQQQEAPPVVDSGGGGVDPLSANPAAVPPVLHAPMVIAPLPMPIAEAVPPVAPVGTAAGAATAQGPAQAVVEVVAAGARAPLIGDSVPSATEPAISSMTSAGGQATRLGYPRYLREPTTGELALLALPGVAGLLLVTASGGFIGYRQANSARVFRTQSAARFLR
jgi:hypothetical protein